jgi:Fic family protein
MDTIGYIWVIIWVSTVWHLSSLTITPEMLSLIGDLDAFKGEWKLLGRLAPERLKQLRKVATIESIGSSTRIEGAQLTDREIEKLLESINTYSFASRDEQEVAGYAFVCDEIFQSYEAINFTENTIKQLHGYLLRYSHKDERHRGEYKKLSNNVEAFDEHGKNLGTIFETTSPFDTPFQMRELVEWVQSALEERILHPLMVIAVFVVIFLAIHPFQDGNGRLSRLLTTLLLLKSGYLYVPYSSLESIIENSKESYYLALRKTQGTLKTEIADFIPWIHFFLRALQKQKIHLEQKVSKEKMLTVHMTPLAAQIVEFLLDHGRLTIGELENLTKSNRNTLKKTLTNLVNNHTISRLGKGKGTWYSMS